MPTQEVTKQFGWFDRLMWSLCEWFFCRLTKEHRWHYLYLNDDKTVFPEKLRECFWCGRRQKWLQAMDPGTGVWCDFGEIDTEGN